MFIAGQKHSAILQTSIKLPFVINASVTFALRQVYDAQITVSVRPPQGELAIIVQIYGHRGLYDFV